MFVFSQSQIQQFLNVPDGWRAQRMIDLGMFPPHQYLFLNLILTTVHIVKFIFKNPLKYLYLKTL